MTGLESVHARCHPLLAFVACAAVCLAALPVARAQLAEDLEEAVKRVVVMVQCSAAEVDRPGAGFLIGMDADRIYIATAAHVVSRCAEGEATRVRFRWSSAPVPARVLSMDARPLDLAVITVSRAAGFSQGQPAVALDRLGDPRLLRRGDPVYALGNPRGIPWGVNAAPDRLASAEGDVLLFASTFIGEGHSGGALLNDRGEIVGMIRGDQPPTGEAVSVSRIIDRVREWKYPVGLRPPLPRLVAGRDLTCRTGPDGSAGCFGDMDFNQSGGPVLRMLKLQGTRFRQIGVGIAHLCGLDLDGATHCRGSNNWGQLGSGNTANSYDDTVAVRQNALVFASIAVGGSHSCALTPQGRAYCWGAGSQGRLGHNSNEGSLVPAPVAGGRTFTALAAGWRNTCGLTRDGDIFCWGGILGTGLERYGTDPPIAFTPMRVPGTARFKLVTSGEDHVCGLTTAGRALCWGGNEAGQLGSGRSSKRELEPVAVAGNHTFVWLAAGYGGDTCGITPTGSAYCWGPNTNGTQGNGTTTGSNVPVPVAGGLAFATISVGINHACGTTVEGQIYCWGGAHGAGNGGTGSAGGSKVPSLLRDVP